MAATFSRVDSSHDKHGLQIALESFLIRQIVSTSVNTNVWEQRLLAPANRESASRGCMLDIVTSSVNNGPRNVRCSQEFYRANRRICDAKERCAVVRGSDDVTSTETKIRGSEWYMNAV